MKIFKHQQIPASTTSGRGALQRFLQGHRSRRTLRRPHDAETYAAYQQPTGRPSGCTGHGSAAMGANLQIGVAPAIRPTRRWPIVGRMEYLLRHGRHVAISPCSIPSQPCRPITASPAPDGRPVTGVGASWRARLLLCPGRRPLAPENDYMDWARCSFAACGSTSPICTRNPGEQVPHRGNRLILDNKENARSSASWSSPAAARFLSPPQKDSRFLPSAERSLPPASCRRDPPSFKQDKQVLQSSVRYSASPPTAR